jgi:molybdenum cofactor synthesis domain-containing protein
MIMNPAPKACLILIGNELLSGRTQDKNMNWLAKALNDTGIRLWHARVIPDIEDIIIETVNECRKQYTYVFTTGGIGPTHDDITAAAIAKAFGVPLQRDAQAQELLENHYGEKLNTARLKMADIPDGATLIANPVSAAPGFQIENVFVMAGVPRIMQAMFDDIAPRLTGGERIESRSLTTNLPESTLAEELGEIQKLFPEVEIGSYPNFRVGQLRTMLVVRSTNIDQLYAAFDACEKLVERLHMEGAG